MKAKIHLPKINISTLRKLIFSVIAASLVFSFGFYFGKNQSSVSSISIKDFKIDKATPADKQSVDFTLFWKVWDTLEANYFDEGKLNPEKMVYGAIKGMVDAVGDPYTVFLSPEENKVTEEDLQGNFQGVGIQIGFKGTQLAVIAPLPGTPAEEAGIKAGDYIIGIKDDKKGIDRGTVGITLTDAVAAIRGDAGSKVTLVLTRDGVTDPMVVEVVRRDIAVPSVTVEYLGDDKKVAHLKLLKFAGDTDGEWETAVKEIIKSGADRIVLDLRNNPGGYLQMAVDISGDFLPNGTVAVIEESSNGSKNSFKTSKFPRLTKYPVVVLVNEGSASASEILAGALRDMASVKLVGDTSFGKGTIQEPRQLEGGAGIHITIAKWLTPNGTWVNEKGLDPDVKIADNVETSEDEQLLKALEVVKSL